ncbi:MAG: ABC transporter substrate-binding protein [Pelagimonas sp.]|uniref:ABC transporter substrate-binding protein n=1 Tax=Pelagimonas sp. TaxID=2073170 RepID=UPI003D6BBDF8
MSKFTLLLTISLTGPGELDWTPVRDALRLWPAEIAGLPLNVVFHDDKADPQTAIDIADTVLAEGPVDAVVQFALSGPGFAMAEWAAEHQVPHFALSPIQGRPDPWTFRLSAPPELMAEGLLEHISDRGYARLAYIGTDDNYGNTWRTLIASKLGERGISLCANESYLRTDVTTLAQAERIAQTQPEAVVIGGPGQTAILPQTDLRRFGFKGQVYQTFGAAMSVLADAPPVDTDGTIMVTGPGSVADLLPSDHAAANVTRDFNARFEQRFGHAHGSQAAISTCDVLKILEPAVREALLRAEPGTAAFRLALQSALEADQPVVTGSGTFNYTKADHFGLAPDGRVLIELSGGQWRMAQ